MLSEGTVSLSRYAWFVGWRPLGVERLYVREDLLFDMAGHVDSTVHQFEEWGLPIM